jgi:hypothetical protein
MCFVTEWGAEEEEEEEEEEAESCRIVLAVQVVELELGRIVY